MFFDVAQPMFWYRPIFMAELFAAEMFFAGRLRPRRHFALRIVLSLALGVGLTFFIPNVESVSQTAWYSFINFLGMFLLSLAALCFSYKSSFKEILICAVAGYTVQHIAQEAYEGVNVLLGLNGRLASDFYGDTEIKLNGRTTFSMVIYISVIVIVYAVLHAIFVLKSQEETFYPMKGIWLVGICFAVLLFNIVISSVITYSVPEDSSEIAVIVVHLYNVICCLLTLILMFELPRRLRAQSELELSERIHSREKQQYFFAKENIDIINIKCHDLKHQIREGKLPPTEYVQELETAIEMYDANVKTGNEALDVILTEKSIYCKKHNIRLSCIADGTLLTFMSSADIYSLFGNLLGNAIEAAEKLDGEERVIGLQVRAHNALVVVSVRNLFRGDIEFRDGLPLTSKPDKAYHGYGMRSIRYIVEQYGGEMNLKTEEHIFTVNIAFPT